MTDFTLGGAILDRAEQHLKCRGAAAMDGLCEDLSEYRKTLGAHWAEFAKDHFGRHAIQKTLHESPGWRRAYEKPRGYAGDAVTIDYAYGLNCLDEATPLGRALYEWEYQSCGCRSIRGRRDLMAARIDETALTRTGARILSVACGHLREARISGAVRERMFADFVALDQDPDSLAVVQAEHPSVRTVCGTVLELLKGEPCGKDFDLVYSSGLYDYLHDGFAQKLTTRLFELLRPGGRLVIANLHPDSPSSVRMEAWMDWWLIYRTEAQVQDLALGVAPSKILSQRTFRGEDGNVAYLEISRADGTPQSACAL